MTGLIIDKRRLRLFGQVGDFSTWIAPPNMILDILPPTSESLSRQVGLLKDPRTRCTKLVAWDAQVSIFLSWPVTFCSQRLYTKLSFKNSLPHSDQYNNSLHPSSIHVPSRGPDTRLATSQLAKGLNLGSESHVNCPLTAVLYSQTESGWHLSGP